MFRAIGRWFKALGYLITGNIDAARRTLDSNPHVIRAKFDDIIRDKTKRIQQYKQAVASLITQEEKKLAKVKQLTEEMTKLEKLKAGALNKAKARVAQLQGEGKPMDEIKADAEYLKCNAAYKDFDSSAKEKNDHITSLEADISEYRKSIGEHKVQLEHLMRDLEKIKSEAADTVADVISAKQEKEIADAISGIGEDSTEEELAKMRELRHEVKAEAKVSKELAGTDTKRMEADFLEYAAAAESDSEFDALIGLASEKESAKPDAAPRDKTALPE